MTPEFRKPTTDPDTPTTEPDTPPEAAPQLPAPAPAPAPEAAPAAVADPDSTPVPEPASLRRSRFGALWVTSILAALLLILLLVFILQNSAEVDISFLGAHGHLPLGAALLLSAVCGLLLVAVPGTGRILQLRRQVRRGLATEGRHQQDS